MLCWNVLLLWIDWFDWLFACWGSVLLWEVGEANFDFLEGFLDYLGVSKMLFWNFLCNFRCYFGNGSRVCCIEFLLGRFLWVILLHFGMMFHCLNRFVHRILRRQIMIRILVELKEMFCLLVGLHIHIGYRHLGRKVFTKIVLWSLVLDPHRGIGVVWLVALSVLCLIVLFLHRIL